jgi:hypothetical protein
MRKHPALTCALAALILALPACASSSASIHRATPTATAAAPATIQATATFPAGPPGIISGDQLMYPADSMPALAIYALSTTDSSRYFYVVTTGQLSYRIAGVAPGTYYVIAYLAAPRSARFKALVGGYTRFLACEGAPNCNDHTLIQVTVHPGETVSHINPNDYYGGIYPPRPGT